MRRVFYALMAVVATVALSSILLAQAPAPTEKKPVAKAAKVEKKMAALSANGKVARFDEATKVLTLSTKEGDKEFTLGAGAKIMSGASTATTVDLAGKNVKVTYSNVDGKNVASKVTIATARPAVAARKVEK
jgi:hypothetical protein